MPLVRTRSRPERHFADSFTTIRLAIARALALWLPRCPLCHHPLDRAERRAQHFSARSTGIRLSSARILSAASVLKLQPSPAQAFPNMPQRLSMFVCGEPGRMPVKLHVCALLIGLHRGGRDGADVARDVGEARGALAGQQQPTRRRQLRVALSSPQLLVLGPQLLVATRKMAGNSLPIVVPNQPDRVVIPTLSLGMGQMERKAADSDEGQGRGLSARVPRHGRRPLASLRAARPRRSERRRAHAEGDRSSAPSSASSSARPPSTSP